MSTPDYPLMAVDGYQTYQLAQIASYLAEALARHRRTRPGKPGQAERADAVRDLAGGAQALARATRTPLESVVLPRPLDTASYEQAKALVAPGPRRADIVSLGGEQFAVIGTVPGIGPVGAHAGTHDVARALQRDFMAKPAQELAVWAVTATPVTVPTLPRGTDLAAFVEHLSPQVPAHRSVAAALRGVDKRIDQAIQGRFRGVDLDQPVGTRPLGAAQAAPSTQRSRPARSAARLGMRRPAMRAAPGRAQRPSG